MKAFTLIVFAVCYSLLIFKRKNQLLIIWAGALLLIIGRAISPLQALASINLNVLGIFWGTMVLAELFILSEAPAFLAISMVNRLKIVSLALLAICVLSGAISAVAENVATVLIIAPIAFEVAKKLGVSPVPLLIGISISSNLQGSATLVGDSASIILATSSGMNFNDFIWMWGKPSIFFAVQLGAIFSLFVLYFFFRKYRRKVEPFPPVKVKSWIPTILLCLMIFSLAISSFITRYHYAIGIICFSFAIIALLLPRGKEAPSRIALLRSLDWVTLFFLIGVFIIVGTFTEVGLVDDIADLIAHWSGNNLVIAYSLVVWSSVFASAFVDNIPYVMAMIPVVQKVAASFGVSQYLFLFGLLLGATIGGNITPIGASANIVSFGLLRKRGYKLSFWDFMRIGLPFTLVAVTVSTLFVWLLWR